MAMAMAKMIPIRHPCRCLNSLQWHVIVVVFFILPSWRFQRGGEGVCAAPWTKNRVFHGLRRNRPTAQQQHHPLQDKPWRFPGLDRVTGSIRRRHIRGPKEAANHWSFPGRELAQGVYGRLRARLTNQRAKKTTAANVTNDETETNSNSTQRSDMSPSTTSWSFPGKRLVDIVWRRRHMTVHVKDGASILNHESPTELTEYNLEKSLLTPIQGSLENSKANAVSTPGTPIFNATTLPTNNFAPMSLANDICAEVESRRGGPYAAISVLVVSDDDNYEEASSTLVRPGCMLVSADDEDMVYNGLWKNNSLALWHSLALLSDLVVLVIRTTTTSISIMNEDLQWALSAGFEQRVRVGLSRGRLLVIVDVPTKARITPDMVKEWKERLVMEELKALRPATLERLDIVTSRQYPAYLRDIAVLKAHGTHSVIDRESFPPLLEQTNFALGGKQGGPLLLLLESRKFGEGVNCDEDQKVFKGNPMAVSPVVPLNTAVASANESYAISVSKIADNTGLDALHKEEKRASRKRSRFPWNGGPIRTIRRATFPFNVRQSIGTEPVVEKAKKSAAQIKVMVTPSVNDQACLQSVFQQLDQLQARQEENVLDSGSLPMDFVSYANPILDTLASMKQPFSSYHDDSIQARIRSLYQQHLDLLRDQFGKMYETMVDRTGRASDWDALQVQVINSFRQAAQQAVPVQAREEGIFRDLDLDYVVTLAGLASDLEKATEMRRALLPWDNDLNGTEVESPASARRKRFVRWCQKLAARGLILGVNYLQGWLAWQGIKRTALDRERDMPKFPLF